MILAHFHKLSSKARRTLKGDRERLSAMIFRQCDTKGGAFVFFAVH